MTLKRRKTLLGLLGALLAGLLGWLLLQRTTTGTAASRSATVSAGSASADVVMPVERGASALGAAPSAAAGWVAAPEPADARVDLARRMKADWCGFGAAEFERQTEAVHARAIARTGMIGMDAMKEVRESVGWQLVEDAKTDARRRWVQALNQRRDERSLAMADYLESGGAGDAAPSARARLQARARTASDPMVTVLALQRPCASGACANVEASQWSRLEPANLQAWLALMPHPASRARQTHAAYVLDWLAQEAKYSRSYQREFHAVRSGLPQTQTPGLQNEAEVQLMSAMVFGWPMLSVRPLTDLCRTGLADAGTPPRCETVARLLARQDDTLHRAVGLGIARTLVTTQPAMRARWEPQAQAYEAVSEWARAAAERAASAPEPEGSAPACGWQGETRKVLADHLARSEWDRMQDGMSEAGVDAATLAARWRKREGRSVLDPQPAAQPASTTAKAG